MGACAISGGPFKDGYNVLKGIDRFIPVDVHIPGCPPRPEALIHAIMTLQRKIANQHLEKDQRPRWYDKNAASEYPIPLSANTICNRRPTVRSGSHRAITVM